jgi:DNA-binding protein WhiA
VAQARDLVEAVRAELAAIDPPRDCCRHAERAGLGDAARGRARSPAVARLAVRLADASAPAARAPATRAAPGSLVEAFDWAAARGHCRAAWLRGRFLAVGSLSLGARGPHLELVVMPGESDELAHRLEEVGFPATRRLRRGRAVTTWKRTDTIIAFLRYCGASASVLEVESRLVMRQLQGHLNRVLNAETANLTRTVASSARHIAIITQLEAEGRLSELPDAERAVAAERRTAPEASFTELSERLGLSRARVQRAFQRLEMAATTTTPASDL